jgi:hypothetical protein
VSLLRIVGKRLGGGAAEFFVALEQGRPTASKDLSMPMATSARQAARLTAPTGACRTSSRIGTAFLSRTAPLPSAASGMTSKERELSS